jgi:hypothetical protein
MALSKQWVLGGDSQRLILRSGVSEAICLGGDARRHSSGRAEAIEKKRKRSQEKALY